MCCPNTQIVALTLYVRAPVSIEIGRDCTQPLLHNEQLLKNKNKKTMHLSLCFQVITEIL